MVTLRPLYEHVKILKDLRLPFVIPGELVDSKCYLGVMNPGQAKVHGDCAARCASGGVPVALVSSDVKQQGVVYFVQNTNGRLPRELRLHIGEIMSLSGQGFRIGEQRFLIVGGGDHQ